MRESDAIEKIVEAFNASQKALLDQLEKISTGATVQAKLDEMRLNQSPPGIPHEFIVGCVSPDTGASFDIEYDVRNGKVWDLKNYRFPKGWDVHVRYGGLVPDGMPIYKEKSVVHGPKTDFGTDESVEFNKGQYDMKFKGWLLESFHKQDRNRFIGKPVPEYFKPKPEAA